MNCSQAQRRITDAALDALPAGAQAEFAGHVAACAACRAMFEAERKLITAVDAELREGLGAAPSPGFAAAVRRRIAAETVSHAPWYRGWAPAVVTALVLLVALVWWTARPSPDVARREPAPREAQPAPPTKQEAPLVVAGEQPARPAPKERPPLRAPRARPEPAAAETLEVLVPPGQWDAVQQFYAAVWSGRVDAAALHPSAPETLAIEVLQTPPLVIPPLASEESRRTEPPRDSF